MSLSKTAIKFAKKVSEGKKGIIPIKELKEIFSVLPGWTLTEVVLPYRVADYDSAKKYEKIIGAVPKVRYVRGPFHGSRVWEVTLTEDASKVDEIKVANEIKSIFRALPAKSSPPKTGTADEVVVIGVSPGQNKSKPKSYFHDSGYVVEIDELWVYREGYLMTSPNTQEPCVLWAKDRHGRKLTEIETFHSGTGFGAFWTWVQKKSGLVQEAKDLLAKVDDLEDVLRPASAMTPDHTGTCQICRRTQKLKDASPQPVMVDHGYIHEKTAGWGVREYNGYGEYSPLGHRLNHCWGVGYAPWEMNSERFRWLVNEVWKPQLGPAKLQLEKLKTGKVKEFRIPVRGRKGMPDGEKILTPADGYEWRSKLEYEISRVERDVEDLQDDIKNGENDLKSWKRTPVYDERKAGKLFYPPFEEKPKPKATATTAPVSKAQKSSSLKGEMVTVGDLKKAGYTPAQIKKMISDGTLVKVDFGWYRFAKEP